MWRRDIGPLQCKGRSGPDHGRTAQTMFVNPEGQTRFTSASKRLKSAPRTAFTNMNRKCRGVVNYRVPSVAKFVDSMNCIIQNAVKPSCTYTGGESCIASV